MTTAVAMAAVLVAGVSSVRAAAPEFLTADAAPEAAAVTLLSVGDNQYLAGPPVRAVDADGDVLTYSMSDADAGSGHSGRFSIDSGTGQISRKSGTDRGVYRVRVSASDATDTATVVVTIHVTSPGQSWHESNWYPSWSVTAGDGSANDWFGVSVDADDEVVVVGAWLGDSSTLTGSDWSQGPGAAYVFDAGTGAQLARLDSPNAVAGGGFGWEVEVVGDLIVVGANKERVSTTNGAGQVHVFTKPATGWADTSTATATLKPGSTSAPGNGGSGLGAVQFGNGLSVSDDGNTIVVGAPSWEYVDPPPATDRDPARINRDGAVFVFTKPATGWADASTDDTGVVRLWAGTEVRRYAAFGNQVWISGDGNTIAVADPFGGDALGYVRMFSKPAGGWVSTVSTDTPVTLSVTGRHPAQRLGSKGLALSADGSTLVVGAAVAYSKGRSVDSQVPADAVGAAYVFARPSGGWADATETAKLTTFGHKYDEFGAGVAISASGNKIAVGLPDSRSSNYRGSAYVYTKPAGGWADDLDGAGDNVRVLTAAAADTNPRQRYGFGGRGLAFVGEDTLVLGQPSHVWALYKKDALSSLPAGGLYGANADMSNLANVPQGSAYLYKLRPAPPAAPAFLESDRRSGLASEAAAVTLLAVGDNQTKAGPPVRAYDANGDRLTYSLSDGDLGHARLFTIDSATGQISRRTSTPRGVYRVRVSASDDSATVTTDVVIHVTSPGRYPGEDTWVEARSVTAGDGSANDWFGVSVAADDEVIVVGAPWGDSSTVTGSGNGAGSGAVYVFDADTGAQLARLDSPVAAGGGWFGWKVVLAGDSIFASAPREVISGVGSAGRVYVFEKPSGGWVDDSTPDATLVPGPTSAPRADATNKNVAGTGLGAVRFGSGLAVSGDGDIVVVGAPMWENVPALPPGKNYGDPDVVHLYHAGGDGLDQDGALFVFTKPVTGWADASTDDTGVVRLYAGSREWRFARLGEDIAVSADGSVIAAAAPFASDAEGYVYMFAKPDGGWVNTAAGDTPVRLSVTGRHRQQRLGAKGIDISGDGSVVVASAPVAWRKGAADDSQVPDDATGAAYVFARPSRGWADATETAKLASFGHKYDAFGGGVAVSASGDKIAVTNSDSRSSNFRGSAYVYTKPSRGWADDLDGAGDNVRVLTASAADSNARQRYGFGGRGLAFVGEDELVVGQNAQIWALYKKDALPALPAGGLYGDNADMSDLANVPQGSAYLFKLRQALPPHTEFVAPPPLPPLPPPPTGPAGPTPPTGPTGPPPEFEDVDEDSAHYGNILTIRSLGITRGTTAVTFSPWQPVARAQAATMLARLWRAAGWTCPGSSASAFTDVAESSSHAANIGCLSALGVVRGTTAATFLPWQPVARAQAATMLARLWVSAGRTCPTAAVLTFDDVAGAHAEGIECMTALRVVRGTTTGDFLPWQPVARAQMATLLARFYRALTE